MGVKNVKIQEDSEENRDGFRDLNQSFLGP